MKHRRTVKTLADSLSGFSEDFMAEKNQPPLQERASPRHEKQNNSQLPAGWVWKRLGEIADINPRIDKSKILDDLQVPFVPMPAVGAGDGQIDVSQLRPAKEVKKGYTPFREGDVLFAKITPCMENGKMAVVPQLINGYGFGSTEFHVLKPKQDIDARYLYHFVSNASFRREAAHRMTGAVGQKRVPAAYLADCAIPLAPLDQQKLIVAEIEKQSSRLDEAVAGLKRIKANLKRYKAAVLKAAVEGKLTEEWRSRGGAMNCALDADNPGVINHAPTKDNKDETGADLLNRILAERKKKWEEKNPGKKYKEPAAPDTSNLPELPRGWVWSSLGQLAWSAKDGPHYSPKYSGAGIPFISGGNVRPEGIDFSTAKYISPELHAELSQRCKPEYGDLLFTKGGTTGIARINTEKREFNVWVHVAVLKLVDSVDRFYIQHALNSVHCYKQSQKYTHGVGNQDLGLTRMIWITVPLPPSEEQRAIIREIDRRLSIIREMEHEVEVNLKRAEHLRQAILKAAFSGKLLELFPRDKSVFTSTSLLEGTH